MRRSRVARHTLRTRNALERCASATHHIYAVPWSYFPIVPSHPHYPHTGQTKAVACAQGPLGPRWGCAHATRQILSLNLGQPALHIETLRLIISMFGACPVCARMLFYFASKP